MIISREIWLGCFIVMFASFIIWGGYPYCESKRVKIIYYGILVILIGWFGIELYINKDITILLNKMLGIS